MSGNYGYLYTSVIVFSVAHQSKFSHQYDNMIAYTSCYTDRNVQEVNS